MTKYRSKDTHSLEVKNYKKKKHISCKWKNWQKKIDFKAKTVKRDEEWHCIMITASVQQVDIIIVNTHEPNIGA